MRKFVLLISAVALVIGVMATSAIAAGDVTLQVSPSPSVVAGTPIGISLSSTTTDGNHLQIFVCYATDDDGNAIPELPLPWSDCESVAPSGIWVNVKQGPPSAGPLVHSFDTTGLAGRTVGISGQHVPIQGNPNSKAFADVQVTAPAVVTERHAGCNGIENAITKVKTNGKAQAKLTEIADRFNCDIE